MRRGRFLSVESLEGRALLSGLSYSLTTDASTYQIGQSVNLTFTETNTSDQPQTVNISPTDFTISITPAIASGSYSPIVWQSDPGNQGATPLTEVLQPGASITQTATWDGQAATTSSTFPVMLPVGSTSPLMLPYPYGSFIVTNPNAPAGTTAPFQINSPFSTTITTDQSVYQSGTPVQMTFTLTNTSSEPAQIEYGESDTGFIVTQGGQVVWQSNSGTISGLIVGEALQPGQSFTLHQTWDGTIANGSTLSTTAGLFAVTNQLDPSATASFQITSPSPLSYSVNIPDKYSLEPGEPINLSYTITNSGDTAYTFSLPLADAQATSNGTTVWDSGAEASWSQTSSTETLQPGQSITENATWNGVANVGTLAGTNVWNDFEVSFVGAPEELTQAIWIASPLTLSVSTDQSTYQPTYQPGQPVQLTWTETNTSNVAITIFNTQEVTWNGTTVWESGTGASSSQTSSTETLQPGQSITQNATWNGVANVGTLAGTNVWGDFEVSFAGAPGGLAKAFWIASPMTVSVSTDQSIYQPGQPVQLTATETNTSNVAITILNTQDEFIVNGNGGVTLPAINGSSSNSVVTLQPGQSQTFTATWNPGQDQTPTTTPGGGYTVDFQDNFQDFASSGFVINGSSSDPTQPPSSTGSTSSGQNSGTSGSTSTTENASPVAASLTVNRPTNQSGHPVRLTIKLKNVTNTTQRLTSNSRTDGITVLQGSTVVSHMSKSLLSSKGKLLKPGQSVQLTSTWTGKLHQAGLKGLKPGLYTIMVNEGGYKASTNIQIQ